MILILTLLPKTATALFAANTALFVSLAAFFRGYSFSPAAFFASYTAFNATSTANNAVTVTLCPTLTARLKHLVFGWGIQPEKVRTIKNSTARLKLPYI